MESSEDQIELKPNEKRKFILIINIVISIIFFILIIIFIILLVTKKETLNNNLLLEISYTDKWDELFGTQILNKSYDLNGQIPNSFKINGDNYNNDIGNINDGNDYSKTYMNYYDLYIPYSSFYNKDKYNGIILFIHGGLWISGNKKSMNFYCITYSKLGYITATMDYTLVLDEFINETSIFRMIDEITAYIQNIKEYLENLGFDVNKLEIALGGISSGAFLSLLYSYKIKNPPIPIKFIINMVGIVNLDPQYLYKVINPLHSILPNDIQQAFNNNKLVKVFENDFTLLEWMNNLLGKKYSNDYLLEMMSGNEINKNNENFKSFFKIVEKTFPTYYINENSNLIPTLSEIAGNDNVVGIVQYSLLNKLFNQYGVIDKLVYMRFGNHDISDFYTENGINAIREMHYQIIQFAKNYFNQRK